MLVSTTDITLYGRSLSTFLTDIERNVHQVVKELIKSNILPGLSVMSRNITSTVYAIELFAQC